MAEEKKGKEPQHKGGLGGDKPQEGEAGGRGIALSYVCWYDHAVNVVDSDWSYFICWRCHRLNMM